MRLPLLYFTAALILSGCSHSTPVIDEYTLLPIQRTLPKASPLSIKTLSVASSQPIGSLRGKNLVYVQENGLSGVYLYSRWSDTPSAMMQRSLLALLNKEALFSSISPNTTFAQTDWALESDMDAFYHRLFKNRSEGYIDITYRLVDVRSKQLLASKRFNVSYPAASMDAKGGVAALKNATDDINRQCIDWLITLLKEKK